jgi:hypothetical protein
MKYCNAIRVSCCLLCSTLSFMCWEYCACYSGRGQHIPGKFSCTSNLLYNCVSSVETEQRRKWCGSVIHMHDFRLAPQCRWDLRSSGISRNVESQKSADLRMMHTMWSGRYGQSCLVVQRYLISVHVAYCCCPSTSRDIRCDASSICRLGGWSGPEVGRHGEEEKLPICRVNLGNSSWTQSAYPDWIKWKWSHCSHK